MEIKSHLFEIMQFCFLHYILLFLYLSVLLKPNFFKKWKNTWFSHALSQLSKRYRTRTVGIQIFNLYHGLRKDDSQHKLLQEKQRASLWLKQICTILSSWWEKFSSLSSFRDIRHLLFLSPHFCLCSRQHHRHHLATILWYSNQEIRSVCWQSVCTCFLFF